VLSTLGANLVSIFFCFLRVQSIIPFAVVGSESNVIIDGKSVRGRKNRWGVVNVENENHCEFMHLRNFLTRSVLFASHTSPIS
jgi:septin family protein